MYMSIVVCVFAAMLQLLIALLLQLSVAGGQAAPCLCENGGEPVPSSTGALCMCQCPSPWAPPSCNFTVGSAVDMVLVVQSAASVPFSMSLFAQRLTTHYGATVVPSRRLTLLEYVNGSSFFYAAALVVVPGGTVASILDDALTPSSWLVLSQHVVASYVYAPPLGPPSTLALSAPLGSFNASGMLISFQWASIAWGLGGIITLAAFPLIEVMLSALCFRASGWQFEDPSADGTARQQDDGFVAAGVTQY